MVCLIYKIYYSKHFVPKDSFFCNFLKNKFYFGGQSIVGAQYSSFVHSVMMHVSGPILQFLAYFSLGFGNP